MEVGLWDVPGGTVLLDCGSAVLSGAGAGETAALAAAARALPTEGLVRAVALPGADGALYHFLANFGSEDVADLEIEGGTFCLPAGAALLLRAGEPL